MIGEEIRERLLCEADEGYRAFQAKLMPGIALEKIIGVRTPILRQMAKDYAKRPEIGEFLDVLPHDYYDENNLHGFILSLLKDYDEVITRLGAFLPYVDNWATCDLLSPVVFKKKAAHERLIGDIFNWTSSSHLYTARFGIEMLMSHFLDEEYDKSYSDRIALMRSEEYYLNMMLAWYFATALAKQYDSTVGYLEERKLSAWVHNKTIQKAIESDRIPPERKDYLRTLKYREKDGNA